MLQKLKSGLGRVSAVAVVTAGLIASSGGISTAAEKIKRDALWKDIGASERIDFAGRLRMHSQRIAASSCYIETGVAADLGRGIVMGSSSEITRILNALENGNARMKIVGAETDPRVLTSLRKVADGWTPTKEKIDALYAIGFETRDLGFIYDWNEPHSYDAGYLVSEITAQYSNPADLLQGDALMVDLAGRQRMLTQQMLQQACETLRAQGDSAVMKRSMELFTLTLAALQNGEASMGLRPSTDENIQVQLGKVQDDWSIIQPVLAAVAAGIEIDERAHRSLFLALNELLIKSDRAVAMYTKYVKHVY